MQPALLVVPSALGLGKWSMDCQSNLLYSPNVRVCAGYRSAVRSSVGSYPTTDRSSYRRAADVLCAKSTWVDHATMINAPDAGFANHLINQSSLRVLIFVSGHLFDWVIVVSGHLCERSSL